MSRKQLAPGALTAPIPPVMVTVGDGTEDNVLTVAWTGILATVPPKTYISVRPRRHSFSMLGVGREFVINLPTVSLAKTVDFVGIYTGAKMDKIEKCGLTRVKSNTVAPPTIAECPVSLECRVTEVLPMGTHHVFIADIVSVSVDESIVDSDGRLRFDRADLLAYAHGEYYSLGEVVGRFGFSTDKIDSRRRTSGVGRQPRTADKSTGAQAARGSKSDGTVAKKADKSAEKAEKTEEKRPFYLDLPKSVRRKSGAKTKGRTK